MPPFHPLACVLAHRLQLLAGGQSFGQIRPDNIGVWNLSEQLAKRPASIPWSPGLGTYVPGDIGQMPIQDLHDQAPGCGVLHDLAECGVAAEFGRRRLGKLIGVGPAVGTGSHLERLRRLPRQCHLGGRVGWDDNVDGDLALTQLPR